VPRALNALLETQELEYQREAALERALYLYRQGTAEVADCLHSGLCGAADRLLLRTFDETAARLPGIDWLKISIARRRSGTWRWRWAAPASLVTIDE